MNIVDKFPPDKVRHYLLGTIVGTVAGVVCFKLAPAFAWQASMLAALAAGVLKEVMDARANYKAIGKIRGEGAPHGVEGLDALATALGGLPAAVCFLVR